MFFPNYSVRCNNNIWFRSFRLHITRECYVEWNLIGLKWTSQRCPPITGVITCIIQIFILSRTRSQLHRRDTIVVFVLKKEDQRNDGNHKGRRIPSKGTGVLPSDVEGSRRRTTGTDRPFLLEKLILGVFCKVQRNQIWPSIHRWLVIFSSIAMTFWFKK